MFAVVTIQHVLGVRHRSGLGIERGYGWPRFLLSADAFYESRRSCNPPTMQVVSIPSEQKSSGAC